MALKAFVTSVIFLFSTAFTSSWAISESEVLSQMVPLLDAGQFYKMGEFSSRFKVNPKSGQLRIRYTKFGTGKGRLGSLVIAPGRTESSLKYLEVAYDFVKRGYSPVYAIDHRGQGFSDRSLQDMQKGHVENFDFYILDFNTFVNNIVLQDPEVSTNRLFLISNSMGGAITAAYLQKYPNQPFKATAFFGSMMKIIYPEGITELKAAALSAAVCTLGIKYQGSGCTDYAPGRGPFRWDERIFAGNNLTQSLARFEFRNELWKRNPKIALGGPTMKWVGEAARANARLRTSEQVKKINIPMQVYSAELDSINDNSAQAEFCNRAQRGLCQRLIVKGAEHEILMEKDSLRSPAMNSMWAFFESL
jgi:lysophospholipase